MDEHRPGEGGSANMPPFPRIVPNEANASGRDETDLPHDVQRDDSDRVVAEAVSRPVIEEPDIGPGGGEPVAADASRPDAEPPPAGPRAARPDSAEAPDLSARSRSARAKRPNRALEELAEHLEDAAARLDNLASSQLGHVGPAGRAAGVATEAIEDFAAYLRSSDLRSIRDDLSRTVREKPLQSLLAAVGAGWVVGKVLR